MSVHRPAPWWRPIAVLACCQASALSCAARAGDPADAFRLELATGVHAGVVPVAIGPERSQWRSRGRDDSAGDFTVPTSDVVRWGACPPWPLGPRVLLRDGGVIAGRVDSANERDIVIVSPIFGPLTLPAGSVSGYRASQATGPAAVTADDRRHLLLLANGDRVAAPRIEWRDGAVTAELPSRGSPPTATRQVSIPADIVRAIDFSAPPAPITSPASAAQRPRIWAATIDGSRFSIAALDPAPPVGGGRVRLAVWPSQAATAVECDADEIVAIGVDGGRATFLAGLQPAAYEQTDAFGSVWPLARGQTVAGAWPVLRGATGFTALGLHAAARVRYRLREPAIRFESLVAVDDTAGAGGSVVVRVLAGAGADVREVFSSDVLRGGVAPLRIGVDLPAATEFELVVDPADGGAVLDRTLWLDPLVVLHSDAVTTAAD
jgi:hypothetical protein